MSNYIINDNDSNLWRCSNNMMELMYQTLKEIYGKEKINNQNVFNFIERFDQDTYGRGCVCVNINKFLKNKSEFILFSELVKQAIELCKKKYEWFDDLSIKKASELYDNLIQEIQNFKV